MTLWIQQTKQSYFFCYELDCDVSGNVGVKCWCQKSLFLFSIVFLLKEDKTAYLCFSLIGMPEKGKRF